MTPRQALAAFEPGCECGRNSGCQKQDAYAVLLRTIVQHENTIELAEELDLLEGMEPIARKFLETLNEENPE